jgi:hypothetical protein
VVFDCETSVEPTQQLRVGFFQVRENSKLNRSGIFHPKAISESDKTCIGHYARSHNLEILTVADFRVDILLKYGYTRHATIVGFNLPFDISRVALHHGVARRDKRGGYSFLLTRNSDDPRIRVKHLNPRAAMIDFSKPGEQDAPRGERKRKLKVDTYRGHFVDIKTLAAALLSRRFKLRSLAAFLRTPTQKLELAQYGEVSEASLDYGWADVQVTWECYQELSRRYAEHRQSRAVSKILSEATIGKAYLQEMGIEPFLGCVPTFDRRHFGPMLCAYYGGRAEVRNRRTVHEVIYCDFKSMYPTVNGLMGLCEFVISDGIARADTTAETRAFLQTITLADLQNAAMWRRLTTLVRVKPDADLFPVRAKYSERTYTIGLNYLTADGSLWYTVADCIVAKLLTGKVPEIEEAITYRPGPRQKGLKPVKILGPDDYTIDPYTDDFYLSLIDLRDEAKAKGDPIEKTLKIIANSTSYGIFIEVNRDDAPKSERLHVYAPSGDCMEIRSKVIEEPGRFFHPLLAVLITGAARLMLGIAEKLTVDCGLDWAFCDTDSLAITRPDRLSRSEFRKRIGKVIDWFIPLNPYKKAGSTLQMEKINYGIDSQEMQPLYCFAISAKRYALFNLDTKANITLRKASAHGLGHLMDPYSEGQAPQELPKPQVRVSEIGVARWQHDLWIRILQAAIDGHPDQVALDWHPSLSLPAAQRYSASSPHMLAWLDQYNAGKAYEDQIRPFGFLLVFTAKSGLLADAPHPESCVVGASQRGRPPKRRDMKPIAPFDSDPARALSKVFCRVTGKAIGAAQLMTYADVLAQYHLSPEHKFENGDHLDRGRTERRHIHATGFVWIGKEANQVGESGEADPIRSAVEEFARSSTKPAQGA